MQPRLVRNTEQVRYRRAIALCRGQRRSPDLFVVIEPLADEGIDADRLKRQEGRGALGQLGIDLGSQGQCFIAIGSDRVSGLFALPIVDPVMLTALVHADPTNTPPPHWFRGRHA
jgi:hypothetical protein